MGTRPLLIHTVHTSDEYPIVSIVHVCVFSTDREDVILPQVLQFFSGSSKIPACGFGSDPKICFTHTDRLLWASTCDLSNSFPRSMCLLTLLCYIKLSVNLLHNIPVITLKLPTRGGKDSQTH